MKKETTKQRVLGFHFYRAEVQTGAVSFKLNVNVKVVESSEKNRTKSTHTISYVSNNFLPFFFVTLLNFFLRAHTLAIICSVFKLQTLKIRKCRRLAFGKHRVELKTRSWRRRKLFIRRVGWTHVVTDDSVQFLCFVI